MIYNIWNNKGGTGKTSLSFQIISEYAIQHSEKKVLVIDLCPQANLSELLLGGLVGNGGNHLETLCQSNPRKTVGGYFENRIQSTFSHSVFASQDYVSKPSIFNPNIPGNVDLLAGDRLVEIQSTSFSSLANTQLPGVNPRLAVLSWIKEFVERSSIEYDTVFIDSNPSFALYTQMGILASEKLIVPVMADDSSRRAIINLFTLIYGLNTPSPIYAHYQFADIVNNAGLQLPQIHLIIRNRITQYMGEASAYGTVLNTISNEISSVMASNPSFFDFQTLNDGVVSVKDFGTTGVVAFAEGKPFSVLDHGMHNISGNPTRVNLDMLFDCRNAVNNIVGKIQ